MNWQAVIGLEVHTQLKTAAKIFSGSATQYGASANAQASAIDLGLPGVLPVLNAQVVEMAIKFGLAVNAEITPRSIFARKNYFYPDLPKGYQISQYELPIVQQGHLDILVNDESKRIGITRAHLEEDAGKSLHEHFHDMSGIDLNRAGVPLLEIVSEPDLRSAEEAVIYLKNLHALVCALDICDGNMQEGSFRCDANVSIRKIGDTKLGTRVELKNINSFKFVEKAINYEIERQIALKEAGETITQETRLYDAQKNQTRSMRSKEEANDYRYFPDPDLLPIVITPVMIERIKQAMPELPQAKSQRFISQYQLPATDCAQLLADNSMADFFEAVTQETNASAKMAANWLLGEISALLNQQELTLAAKPISVLQLASLLNRIQDNTLSHKSAKIVLEKIWRTQAEVDAVIEREGLKQVQDSSAIQTCIDKVLAENPDQIQQYLAGKEKVLGFLVGAVMKLVKGQANPTLINQLLKQSLIKFSNPDK